MRILVATDAWKPQVNGVVRSLESVARALREFGAEIEFLTPQGFATVPLPTYGEIRLALASRGAVSKRLEGAAIDHIHIATEGPVGFAARRYCLRAKRPFTTSYHTRFPEYIAARTRIPEAITYALLRRFHNAGSGVMVSTASIADDLNKRGFQRLMRWSRGVDHSQFSPAKAAAINLPRPVFLYAGRLAPEKNVEAFLALDLPGSKLVAGDGPSRRALEASYPQAHFLGTQAKRRARRSLCLGGRFGVSEPDRYVRHGPARSARLRAAGGGAAGAGAARCHRHERRRRTRHGSARRLSRGT